MFKKLICIFLLAVLVLQLSACAYQAKEEDIVENTYTFLAEGAEEAFIISIFDSGMFTYSEGVGSDYIGAGSWTLEGNKLCLTDYISDTPLVNYFTVKKNKLVFVEEGSDNFPNVKLTSKCEFDKIEVNE